MSLGATPRDWAHFDLVLGLGADLLPVVPDPNAPASAGSKVEKFGKIPSSYDRDGNAHGLREWPVRVVTPADIQRWSRDERLSMCVRASACQAIDVDIVEPELAQRVRDVLPFPYRRIRANSPKFLVPVQVPGPQRKRIISCGPAGRIEFLAAGQQWLASGCHESGVRYEWEPTPPQSIPQLTAGEFEGIWATLSEQFGVGVDGRDISRGGREDLGEDTGSQLREIDDATLVDLKDALAHPPLLAAAADNAVWSEIGYALLSLGLTGCSLFRTFSEAAPNFELGAPQTWWEEHETQIPRSDYRRIFTLARRLGWRTVADVGAFPVVAHEPISAPTQALIGVLPDSYHRTTDLANAHRLRDEFGGKHLIVIAGDFYAWSGKRWERSESEAARCAAALPRLVKREMDAVEARYEAFEKTLDADLKTVLHKVCTAARPEQAAGRNDLLENDSAAQALRAFEELVTLRKWRKACEMQSTQLHARELLRSLLQPTTPIVMDKDNHLLNCLTGTINLRTGEVKAHDPNDFITKLAPVEYNRDARASRFESFLVEIMDGDERRAQFLQQWFGYCATGDVREQKMVLHIGPGSNGKSTLLDAISDVLGDYASAAPSGLLTAPTSERHPTEIADLAGKRLVTAHESDEGSVLRETLLKQATGGDRLKARYMHKDFFEFEPTHKLQLLTNHKPTVRGQDYAIWRRLLLVWYSVSFGSPEDVAVGKALRLGDVTVPFQIEREREGVFNWIVQGAKRWYAEGLRPPSSVIEAGYAYQSEQDRIAQFVRDCCIVDAKAWSSFSGQFGGLYPAYTSWSRENGFSAMGSTKFIAELERVVPGYRRAERKTTEGGTRKTVRGCYGLLVNTSHDGGGVAISANENLL